MEKIDKIKLKKLYEATKTSLKDDKLKEKLLIFESSIYFDGRQYSLKIPKRLFDYMEFSKGDKINFIIDDSEPTKPKISIVYAKVEK